MSQRVQDWICVAESNRRATNIFLTANGYGQVCWHSQQCSEKWMKALLVLNGLKVKKITNLEKLLALLNSNGITLPNVEKHHYKDLTYMGLKAPYPGFNATKEDAERCIEIMNLIRTACKEIIDNESKGNSLDK